MLTVGYCKLNDLDFEEKLDVIINDGKYTKILLFGSLYDTLRRKTRAANHITRFKKYISKYPIEVECHMIGYSNKNILNSFILNYLSEHDSFIGYTEEAQYINCASSA